MATYQLMTAANGAVNVTADFTPSTGVVNSVTIADTTAYPAYVHIENSDTLATFTATGPANATTVFPVTGVLAPKGPNDARAFSGGMRWPA